MSPCRLKSLGGLCRGKKSRRPSSFVSLSELADQIECNLQHYDRIQSTFPESGGPSAPQSPNVKRLTSSPGRGPSLLLDSPRLSPYDYDPAYEVDPDTMLLLCLPWQVTNPSVIWRRIKTWFRGLFFWQQPERTPWDCLGTCGPFFHDLPCPSHPLYKSDREVVYNKRSPKKSSPKERSSSLKGKEAVARSKSLPSSSRKEPLTGSKSLSTTLSPTSSSSSITSTSSSITFSSSSTTSSN